MGFLWRGDYVIIIKMMCAVKNGILGFTALPGADTENPGRVREYTRRFRMKNSGWWKRAWCICMACLALWGSLSEDIFANGLYGMAENDELEYDSNEEDQAPSVRDFSIKAGKNTLPSSYDSRGTGAVSPVKKQGKWGTCWAHAVIACAESNMLLKHMGSMEEADLSERHLAYYTYHTPQDPLGNAIGDKMELTKAGNYLNQGGNSRFAAFTLANWAGFAAEQTAPYQAYGEMEDLPESCAYTDQLHLENAYWISPKDMDHVKEKIMELGAAAVHLYSGGKKKDYYNAQTGAFYCQEDKTGHVVAVVGWDDGYPKENFNSDCRPSSNGAWLAKDSKGEAYGKDGYIWISYEDTSIQLKNFTFFDVGSPDKYQYNYHYDGTAGSGSVGFGYAEGVTVANLYTANAKKTGAEAIQAAGFAVGTPNMEYSIQVYKNVRDKSNPESGIPVFQEPQTGTVLYCGYYTVPLKEKITAGPGETFAIVIALRQKEGKKIWFHADYSDEYHHKAGDVWCRIQTTEMPGQSLYRRTGRTNWRDAATADKVPFTLRIKGLTSDTAPVSVDSIAMEEKSVNMALGERKQLNVSFAPSDATDVSLKWRVSNPKKASVTKDGTVTAKAAGKCVVTARTSNGREASCEINIQNSQETAENGKLKRPKLSDAANKHSGIQLKWQKVSGALGYYIYRKETGGKWKKIAVVKSGAVRTFTDKSVKFRNGKTYFYGVEAYRGKKTSGYSKTGKKAVRLLAPRQEKPKSRARAMTVVWGPNKKADGYQVQYSLSAKFTKAATVEIKSGKATKKTIRKLKKRAYYIRIRSCKKSGKKIFYSDWSSVRKVWIK